MTDVSTLVELLELHVSHRPGAVAFTQWGRTGNTGDLGRTAELTYAALHDHASRVAALVTESTQKHDRVVLVMFDQISFITAFVGTQLAGRVPVPASPPSGAAGLQRLIRQIEDCDAALILVDPLLVPSIEAAPKALLRGRLIQSVADAADCDPIIGPRLVGPTDLAFLQYTSGSTSAPKGVCVSHENILANERLIEEAFGHGPETVIASWLPSFHDMGLIGGILQPLYLGVTGHLMAPTHFLDRPGDWLRMIQLSGATTSGSPNFGYDLCVRRVTAEVRATLDLGGWRVAFNGAEPVSATTLERFSQTFATAGFKASAGFPCYGLAEATLFVTGAEQSAGPVLLELDRRALGAGTAVQASGPDTVALVSSGRDPHNLVAVVDAASGTPCPDGTVGEIVVSGPSVTSGYWRNDEATCEVFATVDGQRQIRTGDLGFLLDGELYVTGRARDLIIVRGRNVHPQDIEAAVNEAGVPVRRGGVVAVGHLGDDGEAQVIVMVETGDVDGAPAWIPALRQAVSEACEVTITTVVLCPPGALPRTTSGKKQRAATRRAWLDGELPVLLVDHLPSSVGDADLGDAQAPRDLVAAALGVPPAGLPGDVPLVALGLDSVRAAGLALTLREQLGFRVTSRDLLSASGLDELLAKEPGVAQVPSAVVEPAPGTARTWQASATQQVFWSYAERFPHDTSATRVRLIEVINARSGTPADTCRVVGELVRRHPALHTRLLPRGNDLQVVPVESLLADPVPTPVHVSDEAAVRDRAIAATAAAVDLEAGPAARLEVLVTVSGRVFLLAVAHHVATDFWSLVRLLTEAAHLLSGAPVRFLPQVGPGVARHARRQRDLLRGQTRESWAQAWRERLDGAVPLSLPPGTGDAPAYSSAPVMLTPATHALVLAAAARAGVTPFIFLLACFHRMLAVYGGTDDVTVAVPFHGRTDPAWRHDLGCFVSTLPVRVRGTDGMRLEDLLTLVDQAVADAETRQDLPLAALGVRVPQSGRKSLATQVGFVLQGFADSSEQGAAAVGVPEGAGMLSVVEGAPKFALQPLPRTQLDGEAILTLVDTGGRFDGALEFDPAAVDADWARSLARAFEAVVAEVAISGDVARVAPILARETGTASVEGPSLEFAETVPDIMLRFAAEEPDRVAVEFDGVQTTRRDLAAAAGEHAATLRRAGVQPGDTVGLLLESSNQRVAWVFGIWLAGATYVPLEVSQPGARLAEVVIQAGCIRVVWNSRERDRPEWCDPSLLLRADAARESNIPDQLDLPGLDSVAYLLFTSGTSGRPKGAMLEHRGLASVAASQRAWFGLDPDDRVLAYAAHSFDAAVFEMVLALTAGATLVVPTADERDIDELDRTMRRRGITAAVLTPSVIAHVPHDVRLPQLRYLALAGEELTADAVDRWSDRTSLFNLYGPTECTIWCTAAQLSPGSRVTIGGPIGNTRVEVVDPDGSPLPKFAIGEIAVSGAGVGRGYVTAGPEQTGFEITADGRRYRTGDMARLDGAGRLEFRGRRDHQVKVRGVRIELREIEQRLRKLAGVADALALVTPDARLVAGVRPATGATLDAAALRRALLSHLPTSMVPHRVVVLDCFPFDRQGKVDRRLLLDRLTSTNDATSPTSGGPDLTAYEKAVVQVAAEVLGRPVLPDTDLFALGMSSIEAARLAGRLRTAMGRSVQVTQVFENPTARSLAMLLDRVSAPSSQAQPTLGESSTDVPMMTPTQQEILLSQSLGSDGTAYHVPLAMELRGDLDIDSFVQAAALVEAGHPALRTRIRTPRAGRRPADDDLTVVPPGSPAGELLVRVIDLRDESIPETTAVRILEEEASRPFDLATSGPLRIAAMRTASDRWWLSIVAHHVLIDGWSLGVVLDDLGAAYSATRGGLRWTVAPGQPVGARRTRSDPADWAALTWPRGGLLRLSDLPDGPARSMMLERGVPPELTRALAIAARTAEVSPFTLALAAWYVVLARRTGRTDVMSSTVLSGRDTATWRTVGCFASTVPLPLRLDRSLSWEDLAHLLATMLAGAEGAPGLTQVASVAGLGTVSASGLMQTLFVQGDRAFWSLDVVDCQVERRISAPPRPKCELAVTFTAGDVDYGGRIALEYDGSRFSEAEAEAWLDQLLGTIRTAADDVGAGIGRPVDADGGRRLEAFRARAGQLCYDRFADLLRNEPDVPVLVDEYGHTWSRARLAELADGTLGNEATEVSPTAQATARVIAAWPDAASTNADPLALVDWLTECAGGGPVRVVSSGDDLVVGILWPLLTPGSRAEVGRTSEPDEVRITTVRLVPPVDLRSRPAPIARKSVAVVTNTITDDWHTAITADGGRVLRLWAPAGVPVGWWPTSGSTILEPAPGVDITVEGPFNRPAAMYGFGELVVSAPAGPPLRTGWRGRIVPAGIECRGPLSETSTGDVDASDMVTALKRTGVPVYAIELTQMGTGADRQRFCFVVTARDVTDGDNLRRTLAEVLPPGAAPDRVVPVPSLPADAAGMASKLQLAEPSLAFLPLVLDVWSAVLGVPVTGPYVSFFDVGGTSAQILALQEALARSTGLPVSVAALFEHHTPRHQAHYLASFALDGRTSVGGTSVSRRRHPEVVSIDHSDEPHDSGKP